MSGHLVPVAHVPPHLRPRTRAEAWGGSAIRLLAIGGLVGGVIVALPGWLGLGAAAGIYGGVISVAVRRRNKAWELVRKNDEAVAMMNSGRLLEAVVVLDHLASQARELPAMHGLLVYNRAVAMIRMGEYPGALALLEAVRDSRWLNSAKLPYRELLAVAFAQTWWGLGRPAETMEWLSLAREATAPSRRGLLLTIEVLVAAMERRWSDCVGMIRGGRSDAEALLVASQLRTLRVLEAFALYQLDPSPQSLPMIESLVRGVHPLQPWDLVSVRSAWPEFHAFCASWGLTPPQETPRGGPGGYSPW